MDDTTTPRVETPVQVMFFDTDCAGVVHNISYLRFIEVARTLLAGELGWQLDTMSENGVYPVVLRTEIDYRKPARLGDHLVVKGWLDRVERMRFWCAFEVVRKNNPSMALATARQSLALVQAPEMKLIRLPKDWNVRFHHLIR